MPFKYSKHLKRPLCCNRPYSNSKISDKSKTMLKHLLQISLQALSVLWHFCSYIYSFLLFTLTVCVLLFVCRQV